MKKKAKPAKYKSKEEENILNEPMPVYRSIKIIPAVLDFPYRKFEKIARQVAFTQKEWAAILHLSEKTLQRYSKDNKSFEGIYVDRILQMQELIKMGLETFTSPEALYRWLKRNKPVLGELLTFDSLKSARGIQLIIDQLSRIQHGVYI
jgi:putative toxin-antitoxin system antitoxin component (TIGR02293 family)